jgi:single-stranded DNA-binding protein
MPSSAWGTVLGHVGNTKMIKTDYMKFSIAVRNKDGSTSWFDVLTSDRYAIRNIDKGDLVMVTGRMEINEFNERKSVTVFAEEVYLLRKKESTQEYDSKPVIEFVETNDEDNPPF